MNYSSHRLRAQERNSNKKLLTSFLILVSSLIFAVFVGLPILAKFAVFISVIKKSDIDNKENAAITLFAPILESLPSATNSAIIAIYGTSEKDRNIILYLNSEKNDETITNDEGKFNFRGINLNEGNNKIEVKAKKDEQESEYAVLEINFKKEPPKLEILEPNDGQKFLGEAKISIKGQTDSGVRISVNDRLIIINNDGSFNYAVTLKDGENNFKFRATDAAGNVTEKELKLNYSP